MASDYPEYDFIGMFHPDPPWTWVPGENDLFLRKYYLPVQNDRECRYCKGKMSQSSLGTRPWPAGMQFFLREWQARPDRTEADLYRCDACGWWVAFQYAIGHYGPPDSGPGTIVDIASACWSKIKTFDLSGLEGPLQELRECLASLAGETLPVARVIELILHCFRSQSNGEVIHVGEPGSDRRDTFLIRADRPLLLRIDRQSRQPATMVQVVRDVLGVEMRGGHCHQLWVSTEKRFQDENVLLPVIIDNAFPITLIDFELVLAALQPPSPAPGRPWETIWPEISG